MKLRDFGGAQGAVVDADIIQVTIEAGEFPTVGMCSNAKQILSEDR